MKKTLVGGLAALTLMLTPLASQAQELQWELVNNSSRNILYIYLSLPDAADWGDDLLGEDTLFPTGQTGTVTVAESNGECLYDVQFILDSKQTIEQLGLDLCAGASITLTDN